MKAIWFTALATAFLVSAPARADKPAAAQGADKPAAVQVMIVGTYHFANPGHDLHNVAAEDVTTPARQAELAALAARLERFKPTAVAVEAVSPKDLKVAAYRTFTAADLTKNRDERVQIGYRIARDLGLPEVYGIDEQSRTIDYFPFDKVAAYAKRHKRSALIDAIQGRIGAIVGELSAAQNTLSIGALLARWNEPALIRTMHTEAYYAMLALGDAKDQPGAELNAAWYLRNAKIFAKLTQVAKPGDRVIVVFGAGHAYWLRHFVETTPGFELVEPARYLVDGKP